MSTLLLSSRYSADSMALRNAATKAGWSVERLLEVEQVEKLKGQSSLALFGEAVFARVVAKALNISLSQPPLDWLSHLPSTLVQRHIRYATLREARSQLDPAFIKPAGEKAFTAKIYASGAELPHEPTLPDSTPVLVIEPVTWEVEFRCFVLEREPVTISIYKRDGQLARDKDGAWTALPAELDQALNFARRVLNHHEVTIPPAFVLDVGIIKDRGWAVIEVNPAWASGIYGCDPTKILPVLQRACVRTDEISDEDRQWIP